MPILISSTMADPLSIAGSAVGIASLGIQLATSIYTYIDALRGREEDLESIRQRVDTFRALLIAVESAEKKLAASAVISPTLSLCQRNCRKELRNLHHHLQRCSSRTLPASSLAEKLKRGTQQLMYPFSRQELSRLEHRLNCACLALTVSLQALDIEATSAALNGIANIQRSSCRASSKVDEMNIQMEALSASLDSIPEDVARMSSSIGMLQSQMESKEVSILTAQAVENQELKETLRSLIVKQDGHFNAILRSLASHDHVSPVKSTVMVKQETPFARLPASDPQQLARRKPHLRKECSCSQELPGGAFAANLWSVNISLEYETRRRHLPSCPWSCFNEENQIRKFQLRISTSQMALSKKTTFMLQFFKGAGKLSLRPTIECIRVVDGRKSPAFQIARCIMECRWWIPWDGLLDVAEHALATLRNVLWERAVSLNEVNRSGNHILNLLVQDSTDVQYDGMLQEFLEDIHSWGIVVNNLNITSLFDVMERRQIVETDVAVVSDRSRKLYNLFEVLGVEVPDLTLSRETDDPAIRRYYPQFTPPSASHLCDVTPNFFVGPVSSAIHNRDEARLLTLLRRNNSLVYEKSSLGMACLAMTVAWPKGVRVIVDALLQQEATVDLGWIVAQGLAHTSLCYGRDYHETQSVLYTCWSPDIRNVSACNHVACNEVLRPILELGIPCRQRYMLRSHIFHWHCPYAKSLIINRLKVQREELKSLALQVLSADDMGYHAVRSSELLDIQSGSVVKSLEKLGSRVPEFLWVPQDWTSVYSDLEPHDEETLELLWTNGFHHLDGFLEIDIHLPLEYRQSGLILWCLDHGLREDSFVNLAGHRVYTTHSIARQVGMFNRINISYVTNWASVHQPGLICLLDYWRQRDSCNCWCASLMGCTPMTVMINTISASRRLWLACTKWCQADLPPGLGSTDEKCLEILQLLTFDKLGISHTCCCRQTDAGSWPPDDLDEEEIREIQQEDTAAVSLFKSLMDEFTVEYKRQPGDLEDFIAGYWGKRMTEVIKEIDGADLSEAEWEQGRALGVVWDPPGTAKGDETITEDEWNAQSTSQYWIEKINNIADGKVVEFPRLGFEPPWLKQIIQVLEGD
ncbi:hypothetical protein F4778DRAFT_333611 [Xylariomycetidae sp. FL2044]|nr:hypothetical protein F4778DRAFT_333611 [Xylariomycetidae sp. FL2044]